MSEKIRLTGRLVYDDDYLVGTVIRKDSKATIELERKPIYSMDENATVLVKMPAKEWLGKCRHSLSSDTYIVTILPKGEEKKEACISDNGYHNFTFNEKFGVIQCTHCGVLQRDEKKRLQPKEMPADPNETAKISISQWNRVVKYLTKVRKQITRLEDIVKLEKARV